MGKSSTLVTLLITNAIIYSVYSSIAPYLPKEARNKGMPSTIVGAIISIFPIFQMLTSFIVSRYISYIGRVRSILYGCTLASISTFGYSFLPSSSYYGFLVIAVCMRALQGVASGFLGTSILAIIISSYEDKIQQCLGLIRISLGIGTLLGPLGASGIYAIGGFSAIFISYGVLFVALVPVLYFALEANKPFVRRENNVSLFYILVHWETLVYYLVLFGSYVALTFILPTLSLHLASFGVSEDYFGMAFGFMSLCYLLAVIFIVTTKLPKKIVMHAGVIMMIIGNILMGPWGYLYIPHSLVISFAGIMLLSIAMPSCSLTAIPLIIEMSHKRHEVDEKENVSDIVAGFSNSLFAFAEVFSPPLSGFLADSFGFDNAQAMLAGVVVLIYAALCIHDILEKSRIVNNRDLDELKEKLKPEE